MSARTDLAEALEAALGVDSPIAVEAYSEDTPRPHRPTLALRADRIVRTPEAPDTHRDYQFALVLRTAKEIPEAAEADLEDRLEEVLDALDDASAADLLPRWSTAERGVFSESNPDPCIVVTLTVTYGPDPTE